MSHSQRYDFDEIPIQNADGVTVGYGLYDGYADLDVHEVDGRPELERINTICVRASDDEHDGLMVQLAASDPVFITIELELKRRLTAGKIKLQPEEPFDPDYAYDLRASA